MKPSPTRALAGLWRSASFRLTLSYGLMAIGTTIVLLIFVYVQVTRALYEQLSYQINKAAQHLSAIYEDEGRQALIRAISLTLSDRVDAEREAYLLLDETGHKLAGNLDAGMRKPEPGGIHAVGIVMDGRPDTGYMTSVTLSDGSTLIVGHDNDEFDALSSLIVQAILVAVVLGLALVMLGALRFRRELERRLSGIRDAARKIGAGALSERVPQQANEDEFSVLSRDINRMLDKIESLMSGVRHVSDTIAHNLRTPLNRISACLQDALQPRRTPDELRTAVAFAAEETVRLDSLFGKLLQLAELEKGVRRRAFRPCRLDEIARDVADLYAPLAEDAHIELVLDIAGATFVHGDADLLASACANLLDNALKHARHTVLLRVERQGDNTACFVVEDDGPGLPPDELTRVGQRFYRLNSDMQGYGLGLASVRAIVALHAGVLALRNVHETYGGSGLRAGFRIPIEAATTS